jgi:hypothetical protein
MPSPPNDTHPAVEAMLIDGYRRMSPAEKLRRVEELNETVLQLAAERIRQEHPGLSERQLRLRVAALWLDRATMIRALDWDPESHGA